MRTPQKWPLFLGGTREKYKILIQDNGENFNVENTINGMELKNIRSRLQVYKGRLIIDSAPGRGCLLDARFYVNSADSLENVR